MTTQARYKTSDDEHLYISHGVLTIQTGKDGRKSEEYALAGELSYDRKRRQLSVPVFVRGRCVTIEFGIVKTD